MYRSPIKEEILRQLAKYNSYQSPRPLQSSSDAASPIYLLQEDSLNLQTSPRLHPPSSSLRASLERDQLRKSVNQKRIGLPRNLQGQDPHNYEFPSVGHHFSNKDHQFQLLRRENVILKERVRQLQNLNSITRVPRHASLPRFKPINTMLPRNDFKNLERPLSYMSDQQLMREIKYLRSKLAR